MRPFYGTYANNGEPDQAVSGLDLHSLLTECSNTIWKKNLKIPPNTPKIGNVLVLLIEVGMSTLLKWAA